MKSKVALSFVTSRAALWTDSLWNLRLIQIVSVPAVFLIRFVVVVFSTALKLVFIVCNLNFLPSLFSFSYFRSALSIFYLPRFVILNLLFVESVKIFDFVADTIYTIYYRL